MMPHKAKRGLGLVVLGVLLYGLLLSMPTEDPDVIVVTTMVGLAMAASLVGGLVLIVWGLLRD
jgi:hypothetical protein